MDYISRKIKILDELEVSPKLHELTMRRVSLIGLRRPMIIALSLLGANTAVNLAHIANNINTPGSYGYNALARFKEDFDWTPLGIILPVLAISFLALQSKIFIGFLVTSALFAYTIFLAVQFQKNSRSFINPDKATVMEKIWRTIRYAPLVRFLTRTG